MKKLLILLLTLPLLTGCGLGMLALGAGGATYLVGKTIHEGKETQAQVDRQYEELNLERKKVGLPLYQKNEKGIWHIEETK